MRDEIHGRKENERTVDSKTTMMVEGKKGVDGDGGEKRCVCV